MKKRVKIDSSILSFIIILTGFSFLFKGVYGNSIFLDNIFDFIGVIVVMKGTFMRMLARGYKKAHSNKSEGLVVDGPYLLTRNPMYLGSCTTGCGFVLILWPWWSLPVFALLFYLRFNREMKIEEEKLTNLFGNEYKAYCRKAPRLLPKISTLLKVKSTDVINLNEAASTKEIRGMIVWPILAFILELFQQMILTGEVAAFPTYVLFATAVIVFSAGFVIVYHMKG